MRGAHSWHVTCLTEGMRERGVTTTRRSARRRQADGKWVAKVTTVSTFPPRGLFAKDAATIARLSVGTDTTTYEPARCTHEDRAAKRLHPRRHDA